ncbi:ATP-binding protein [Actinokineospora guangxiensis]|uniref:histidine kinase n=1 Tax=Actinokineospora guangxiensis TaxID=1490288 RepID=A0ABW0EEH6_9PSEU
MPGTGSLARQLLGWQFVIVAALLGAVAVFSAVQSREAYTDDQSRRMLNVAEDVAATPGVRAALLDPLRHHQLPTFATSARNLSGARSVRIALPDTRVLTSPDPAQVGEPMALGESTVRQGRAWTGEVGGELLAHVPVVDQNGAVVGIVAAGVDAPSLFAGIVHSPSEALAILAVATVLGVGGSLLVARRVKRQTLGLEPAEIAGLVEHREAMLHGIREGVLGLDAAGRVTLANDQARKLLALPQDPTGVPVTAFGFNERIIDVLTARTEGADQIVLRKGRVLVLNRMPIDPAGAVVTLRDRTEIVALQNALDANRSTTDTLRAQAHEFSNRLHTIAGLIELGEYDELRHYVDRVSGTQRAWQGEVSARIADTAVAALLVAKSSLAAEQGAGIRLDPASALGPVDERLSADLVTVLGNLVDNAVDALGGRRGWIEVSIAHAPDEVRVVVRDSGPGIAPEIAEEVFRHGFTTKAAEDGGGRGLGLAITRQTCVRRGGSVEVHNDNGAVFTARMKP